MMTAGSARESVTSALGQKLIFAGCARGQFGRIREREREGKGKETHPSHDVPPGLLKVLVFAVEVYLGLHPGGDAVDAEREPHEAFAEERAEPRKVAVCAKRERKGRSRSGYGGDESVERSGRK